jgi:hypothetical protein
MINPLFFSEGRNLPSIGSVHERTTQAAGQLSTSSSHQEPSNPGAGGIPAHRVTPSEADHLLNPVDETADYHLYQAMTDAAGEMEVDWPESFDWKRTKARINEIALACFLLATFVGFAIVCWVGLGYIGAAIFSVT